MKVLIEKCEVTVPRRGQQQDRKRLKRDFRKKNPSVAADFECQPWYVDPDSPYADDDCLTIHYEYMVEPSDIMMCSQSFLPIGLSWKLQEHTCGPVKRYSKEEFSTSEYSYPLTASFALAMLQHFGFVPTDAVLANETDRPFCCEEEDAA